MSLEHSISKQRYGIEIIYVFGTVCGPSNIIKTDALKDTEHLWSD